MEVEEDVVDRSEPFRCWGDRSCVHSGWTHFLELVCSEDWKKHQMCNEALCQVFPYLVTHFLDIDNWPDVVRMAAES